MTGWRRLVGDRPIVTRLVLAVAAAMTGVLVVSAGIVYWRVEYALDRQLDQDLQGYRVVVERAVRRGVQPPTRTPGEDYQVYGAVGRLLDASITEPRLLDREQVASAMAGVPQKVDVGAFLPPPEHAFRVVARRVVSPAGPVVVASAISRRKHDEALRELLLQLGIADFLALLAALFVGYRTARGALDPVEAYRKAAEEAGTGGGRLPVAAGREDELTRLGHTFNALLDRTEAANERERQLLADASHELRTPLSLLKAEVEWAALRPRSQAEMATVLASVGGQIDRLADVANALLDLEELRSESRPPRAEVSVDAVVAKVLERFGRTAAEQGRRLRYDGAGVVAVVNERWLDLAVGNLVGNALQHGTGTVTVAARTQDGRLRLSVADEGPGFEAGFADRAFDRFTRADTARTTRGSGLGLALVRAVAEAHGGRAVVDPAGPGAVVVLDLPAR